MRFLRTSCAFVILTAGICGAQTVIPIVSTLNPSSIASGTNFSTSVTVNGANFLAGAVVLWNGTGLSTSFQNSSQLVVTIPPALTALPGFATIVVSNPGGILSNGVGITITAPNISISTTSLPGGVTGTAYTAVLAASGGVAPYFWTSTGTLPPGLNLNSSGILSGTPTTGGTFTVSLRVTDAQGVAATKSLTVTITGLSITTPASLPTATVGQAYSRTLTVTGGTPPYLWSVGTGLPPGLTLTPGTGAISGTPTASGTFNFAVQANDSAGQSATQTFTLIVNPAPLSITTVPPLFDGIVGTPYSQTFTAAGGTRPYTWSISTGSTGGLTLSATTGVLQGTPQTAGTFNFTVVVADAVGARVSMAFSVVIRPPTLSIVTGASLPAGTVGVAYNQSFSVVGGTPPYTWSLVSGSVPGLDFDPTQVSLTGTPSAPGTFPFTLQVRDSAGVITSRAFTVSITAAALTITNPTQLPDGTLGAAYSFQMTATGGVAPYTWTATGLPSGLSIDTNTGQISGTMGAAQLAAFAVTVTDSARVSISNQFRINVTLPRVPNVSISGLPATAGPAQQFTLQIAADAVFPVNITGQATLSFVPDAGGNDGSIQFDTTGTTASFTIPAGSTTAQSPLKFQTGTVAGQIKVTLLLKVGDLDVTPSPAPAISTHIDPAAPVIQTATLTRASNGFSIQIVGYSTAREVTQATFTFTAAAGQMLQSSQVVVPVTSLFSTWFQNAASNATGSTFVYTQPFTVQGDATAVLPQSVTLTNSKGTISATIK